MQEIELKFLVPQARLKGLMRQAKVKASQDIHMAAHYYDTPKQDLAQAGIGLRIRQEGENWVQTIKAGGDGIAARLEHNALLDNERVQAMLDADTLMPDLSIYKDTSIAPALADFTLKKLAKKLTRQYVTDVQRTTRLLEDDSNATDRGQSNSSIEVAYDYGEIIHGNDNTQRQAIQEIEFELVTGELAFLFTTAKKWCKHHKLCLSTVTKAERGGLLIKGQDYSPAVRADLQQLNINKNSSMPAFIRAAVHNCLLQILPNSSAIVAGSEDDKHVRQLVIGIRRLHTALMTFNAFSEQLNPEWQPILQQTANLLADYHQLMTLMTDIEPELQQYNAPSVDWTADVKRIKVKPIDAVGANDFQLTLLELIAFTMSDPSLEATADKMAVDKIAKILSKQHSKFLKAKDSFNDSNFDDTNSNTSNINDSKANGLNDDAQDKLQRHLDHLRTVSEFSAPLYTKNKNKRWLKRILKAQKSLEKYLENEQYQRCYQQKSVTDPNALFGAGWFAATVAKDAKRCQNRLTKLQDSKGFWADE